MFVINLNNIPDFKESQKTISVMIKNNLDVYYVDSKKSRYYYILYNSKIVILKWVYKEYSRILLHFIQQ